MTVQVAPWQETFNSVIRLSISEQLQVLFALARRFGVGNRLPSNLNEADYVDNSTETNDHFEYRVEDEVVKENENIPHAESKPDSTLSIKYGDGEPYSFLKVAATLNLDGPPDWSWHAGVPADRGRAGRPGSRRRS